MKKDINYSIGQEISSSHLYKDDKKGLPSIMNSRFNVSILIVIIIFITVSGLILQYAKIFPSKNHKSKEIVLTRGNIVDRNGEIIATNLDVKNLYVNSKKIQEAKEVASKLVKIFPDLKYNEVYKKMTSGKTFEYVKKKLTPKEVSAINYIGDPGLEFETIPERVYPQGKLFAHVLGIVNNENNGVSGLEKMYNQELRGKLSTITISLDSRVQNVMYSVMNRAMEKYEAKGVAAILMNPNTGEVLSYVSLPAFDPKNIGAYDDNAKFDKISQGVYEVGSILKVFNTAAAISYGIPENKKYEVWQPLRMGKWIVKDYHKMKEQYADMGEILSKSSNIGSAKMVEEMGTEFQKDFLTKINVLSPLKTTWKIASPIIPSKWTKIISFHTSYGYSISMAPFQYLLAFNSLVNGGFYINPRFDVLKKEDPIQGTQINDPEISKKLRPLLLKVMQDGSGQWSKVRGIDIGGKTGTAEKYMGGEYNKKKVITFFVSAFPIQNPKYTLLILFDEPREKAGVYGRTAGANAAPVSKEIIENIYNIIEL